MMAINALNPRHLLVGARTSTPCHSASWAGTFFDRAWWSSGLTYKY